MEFQALSQIPSYIPAIGNNSLKGHFKWPVEAKIVTSEYIRSISPYTGFLDKDKAFIFPSFTPLIHSIIFKRLAQSLHQLGALQVMTSGAGNIICATTIRLF